MIRVTQTLINLSADSIVTFESQNCHTCRHSKALLVNSDCSLQFKQAHWQALPVKKALWLSVPRNMKFENLLSDSHCQSQALSRLSQSVKKALWSSVPRSSITEWQSLPVTGTFKIVPNVSKGYRSCTWPTGRTNAKFDTQQRHTTVTKGTEKSAKNSWKMSWIRHRQSDYGTR